MLEEGFLKAEIEFLEALRKSPIETAEIQIATRPQQNSDNWYIERRKRLTASKFGEVCKIRETTSCRIMVSNIIYSRDFFSTACQYGTDNEAAAKESVERIIDKTIRSCGLFIDEKFPFLGASPDGIKDKDILEIKCPWSARNVTPEEGVKRKFISFCIQLKSSPCTFIGKK